LSLGRKLESRSKTIASNLAFGISTNLIDTIHVHIAEKIALTAAIIESKIPSLQNG
jgi:hypothetical protein